MIISLGFGRLALTVPLGRPRPGDTAPVARRSMRTIGKAAAAFNRCRSREFCTVERVSYVNLRYSEEKKSLSFMAGVPVWVGLAIVFNADK